MEERLGKDPITDFNKRINSARRLKALCAPPSAPDTAIFIKI